MSVSRRLSGKAYNLVQVNLEFLVVDKRTFLTDKERALQTLFGEASEQGDVFSAEVATIADRLASAFASIKVGVLAESLWILPMCLGGLWKVNVSSLSEADCIPSCFGDGVCHIRSCRLVLRSVIYS